MENTMSVWTPRMLSILRIVSALIFLAHGTQKLLGFPRSEGTVAPFSVHTNHMVYSFMRVAGADFCCAR
ncbi:DoxX family protein [Fodinicurvata halophila]|uniref:DoxX family protein n=1 Tax=Fodinicurvata halophila TaxID=1419723 RepID=A0ABV8UI72_9PROT